MNEFARLEKLAERLKVEYPKGTRIELEAMGNDPRPIESGTRGTVDHVDDLATIHCIFDNGRRLGIISGEDQFHKLTPRELLEEKLDKISEEKQIAYYEKVFKGVVQDIDWRSMKEAYKNGDMTYPTELLRTLYEKYLEVYDRQYRNLNHSSRHHGRSFYIHHSCISPLRTQQHQEQDRRTRSARYCSMGIKA